MAGADDMVDEGVESEDSLSDTSSPAREGNAPAAAVAPGGEGRRTAPETEAPVAGRDGSRPAAAVEPAATTPAPVAAEAPAEPAEGPRRERPDPDREFRARSHSRSESPHLRNAADGLVSDPQHAEVECPECWWPVGGGEAGLRMHMESSRYCAGWQRWNRQRHSQHMATRRPRPYRRPWDNWEENIVSTDERYRPQHSDSRRGEHSVYPFSGEPRRGPQVRETSSARPEGEAKAPPPASPSASAKASAPAPLPEPLECPDSAEDRRRMKEEAGRGRRVEEADERGRKDRKKRKKAKKAPAPSRSPDGRDRPPKRPPSSDSDRDGERGRGFRITRESANSFLITLTS